MLRFGVTCAELWKRTGSPTYYLMYVPLSFQMTGQGPGDVYADLAGVFQVWLMAAHVLPLHARTSILAL